MPQTYTQADAKAYVQTHLEDIMRNYHASKDVPSWARTPKMESVWQAGCWLNSTLRELGASEEEVHDIGFAHGQRSFFGDEWAWAVRYANEFAARHEVADKPGPELADRIHSEVFDANPMQPGASA